MLPSPFDLSAIPRPLRGLIRFIGKISVMEQWYLQWRATDGGDVTGFLAYILQCIGCRYEIRHQKTSCEIPIKGPLVIVANHPLGAIEGMILAHYLLQYRSDLKVVANKLLLRFPEFQDLFIGVDILGKQPNNRQSLQELNDHLSHDGAVLIFPAGTVGNLNWRTGCVEDASWHTTAAKLALRHNAWCLPVHVEGRNNKLFYLSAWVNKRLRTLLLPRAMLKCSKYPVNISLGNALKLADVGVSSARAATDYLRISTELVGEETTSRATPEFAHHTELLSVDVPLSIDHLREYELLRQGERAIFCVPYNALGSLKYYLAAERERTFRAAGEGTGRSLDIDDFDLHYWHLIAWDYSAHRLIGAYRAFKVSDAMTSDQKMRLYSRSLFHYPDSFLTTFSGAIEVGRSFVTEPYQRDPRALDLLWQGLGALLLQHPDCHTFIGCVSISGSYTPLVRGILHDTLLAGYRIDSGSHQQITPSHRFITNRSLLSHDLIASLSNVSAINKLLGHAGLDVRVPVLIRHYLALNGRFIDFSLNRSFNDSLDGLIVVDLRKAPDRYLKRYLGEAGKKIFQQNWSISHVA